MRWPEKTYLINREYRFVYCPIPKVAMSSIKLWLLAVTGDPDRDLSYAEVSARLRERASFKSLRRREARSVLKDADYFKFVFVRNPWSRLVSAYLNKFIPFRRQARPVIEAVRRKDNAAPEDEGDANIPPGITFRDFVTYLAAGDPTEMNRHWRHQHLFLGGHAFDFVGKFERLKGDFSVLRQKLGIQTDLPHRNPTTYDERTEIDECLADWKPERLRALPAFPSYRKFYCDDLVDLVARVYAEDIRRFEYEF